MTKEERYNALVRLGELLREGNDEFLQASIKRSAIHNGWFTEANQQQAINAIATQMLDPEALTEWIGTYDLPEITVAKQVGVVMAGNLPLVGFHDLLAVFMSGHQAVLKLSDKDPYLIPAILRALKLIDERTADYFKIVTKLAGFDAVIATGSNNSARYFKEYFSEYPHIIRQNRNAVAVLTGEESKEELLALGHDIFDYFGLGCRNVSKLYLPEGYDFKPLLEALHEYRHQLINHTKYKNNFDYNYALYVLNRVPYEANGCILMTENASLQSPIATLHYEYYSSVEAITTTLLLREDEIQLVVSQLSLAGLSPYKLGDAQQPGLSDYADGVDTMAFLLSLQ
ncbi:MAG: acyl-CoA reductase [Lewinella sp.]|jgi:hypothetical protein|uniref:acyl-CoA reductase n=1 Tax=Lewinella sp. TaxID=2004506 RepID=UPI003D6C12F0